MPVTFDQVKTVHQYCTKRGFELIAKKNHDYAGKGHEGSDALSNFRIAQQMNLVDNVTQSMLVRLTDKLARMAVLSDTTRAAKVSDESFTDTAIDAVNYSIYCLIGFLETSGHLESFIEQIEAGDEQ